MDEVTTFFVIDYFTSIKNRPLIKAIKTEK